MSASLEYLHSLTNFESQLHKVTSKDFHLERVKELLGAVGNPQEKLNVIHVAGTKGKGSTCAMIASVLQHAGFKVGLYTSPHLHRLNERIRILDKNNVTSTDEFSGCISDEQIENLLHDMRPSIASLENKGWAVTYFEVLTVIAGLYFVQEKVDFAILETGLGGRLDATNAFDSKVVVLTPISLDHTKILGSTLKQIAQEKAAIIKHTKQQVVIAPQEDDVMDVLKKRCSEFGVNAYSVHPTKFRHLHIALKGDHQLMNASCAATVVDVLNTHKGVTITPEALKEGLKHVRWHGRFETLQENPVIVVDGAHNPASIEVLAKTVLDEYAPRKIILVVGLSSDKDITGICEPLKLISDCIILTQAKHPRSYEFSRQEAHDIFMNKEWFITPSVENGLSLALTKAQTEDVIVVTGSFFVVGEARDLVKRGVKRVSI
jgi:dihydrofolate synthase/folylpolyglutamate synthase